MKKSAIRIVSFIILVVLLLAGINRIFKFKYGDGIYSLSKFYELEDNSVDVLILGSSHAFESFNTGVLWDEYGVASYILGGSVQPIWNTYYYLKEALKTQTPELIILEGYMMVYDKDYFEESNIIKNTFGLHWSKDKIDAILASAPEEDRLDYLLDYSQYHNRYSQISAADFKVNQGNPLYDNWKGFGCNMDTQPVEFADLSYVTDEEKPIEKNEKYFRMIMQLAEDKNIPVVVMISPYAWENEHDRRVYNTLEKMVKEYDSVFVDFNKLRYEIGLDDECDYADMAHMNYRGNRKFTSYVGNYIKDNYSISNRYGDPRYDSWQRDADYLRLIVSDSYLSQAEDLESIGQILDNDNYEVFVSFDGDCSNMNNDTKSFINSIGIEIADSNEIWHVCGNKVEWVSTDKNKENYVSTRNNEICLRRNEPDGKNEMIVNGEPLTKVSDGINFVIFDKVTDKVALAFGVDLVDESKIVR